MSWTLGTMTSGVPVRSIDVVVTDETDRGRVLDRLHECLAGHFDVEHSTFQLEPAGHRDHEAPPTDDHEILNGVTRSQLSRRRSGPMGRG